MEIAAAVCASLKAYISTRYIRRGRKPNKQRRKMSIVSGYLFNQEQLKIKVFGGRATKTTGISSAYIKAGMKKYRQNRVHPHRTSESNEETKQRSDHLGSREFLWRWFHNDCPLVELNKDRPEKLKGRKMFKKDGTNLEKLTCEHHLMTGNRAEIAQSFLDSQAYKDRQAADPKFKMSLKTVEKSICPCMRQSDGCDCTCDKCAQITNLLRGLREAC